ncbi:hypothetical protein Acsp03_70420 [Actinomadura sp. NBRC 104412]|uniref:hypothetical protein n=1 Tax=Actinomadura sp. NBRC 104412 TaxID=3032203 RepID=UPI0024A08E41|nr:hypothetical protein [Actinomadura sp. NBRC 104412]GLZ09576.1 hypothetical protein Acsp03_70420 [Actinomadura sp. NBRC 104412]
MHLRLSRTPLLATVVAGAVALGACSGGVDEGSSTASSGNPEGTRSAAESEQTNGCHPEMHSGELPTWARSGFSEDARVTYVLGERGLIAGVVFGHPLHVPPGNARQNKILWVAKERGSGGAGSAKDAQLKITAVPADGGQAVERVVEGGPGPSIIDMPKTGCWSFTLRWGGLTDTLDLYYQAA